MTWRTTPKAWPSETRCRARALLVGSVPVRGVHARRVRLCRLAGLVSELVVAPVGFAAAKHAVTRWHYSGTMPPPRRVMFGVWEAGTFAGVVIFSRGASPSLGKPFALKQNEICELTRVALRQHEHAVSEIVAEAIRQLHRSAPGLRLIISFADPAYGHHGGIYQAGNWLYLGVSQGSTQFVVNGALRHSRTLGGKQFGSGRRTRSSLSYLREHIDPAAEQVKMPGKHRYAMPLDKAMRRKLRGRALPYPERAAEDSIGVAALPASRAGCDPRRPL